TPATQDRFLTLLQEHRKILHSVSAAYCRDAAERQNLVQDMVVQLWRSFGRYDERYRFSTWMYRIALNVAISFVRSERRRARVSVPLEEALMETVAAPEPPSTDQDFLRLQRFIDQLGEMDRALIALHLDGNRYDAIAEVLGLSETNVGTKLNRIKQKLREWARAEESGG
ncbi:MAG TPA: sigma-70 family RNA polymerase sigma factor, partial [Myxococcaceae bacterium]